MWFVFPQLRGLGHSSMATFYVIASLDEARAYLAHLILAPMLELCTRTVLKLETGSLNEISGAPDDVKFQSSMTLFAVAAANPASAFQQALDRWRSPRSTDAAASRSVWPVLMRLRTRADKR